MIFCDRLFSRKLERTEARSCVDFVETRARLDPEHGAMWIDVGGTYAMFDGTESPLTQTFGLGMFDEITDTGMQEIETFFESRRAPVFHEVSPMADPALLPLLNERGYQPVELTSVMFRPIEHLASELSALNPRISTRVIEADEVDLWARTSADGWSTEFQGMGDFMFPFARIGAQCRQAFPYIAELGEKAISTGALLIYDDIAILAGASTIPEGRSQGAQNALLAARLNHASGEGCTVAMMCASPGSVSQRNAEKNGFLTAYTRTKWQKK